MLGRDSRTLSKLFEEVAYSSVEYGDLLIKIKGAMVVKQKKVIEGLKY